MPSPFPGMDPYIENSGLWSDFHLAFLAALRGAINAILPSGFRAFGERHVWLVPRSSRQPAPALKPDVFVQQKDRAQVTPQFGSAVIAAPLTAQLPVPKRQSLRYLKIINKQEQRVVTVMEVFSPKNKHGVGHQRYREKRDSILSSGTNLVEVDLLCRGKRPPLGTTLPPSSHYYLAVCRAVTWPQVNIWPFSLRDTLPPVPIPLLPGIAEPLLSLRPCVDEAYDRASYSEELAYDQPLTPPWTEGDNTWARELLAQRQGGA